MKNFEWLVYTYRHRRAFAYTVEKLIRDPEIKREMLSRAKVHDMDKMVMYLFLDQLTSQLRHVHTKPHHPECPGEKSRMDVLETVLDYECAPYTKPDKPLNAYDFVKLIESMYVVDPAVTNEMLEIMHELGIDSSYDLTKDRDGMAYMESIGEVTEEMIMDEIRDYLKVIPAEELEYLKQSGAELPVWIKERIQEP